MDLTEGAQAFQILARHLKETGAGGLRRDLNKAIRDAGQPIAKSIGSLANLKAHMPDPYAAVLNDDLKVATHARSGPGGGITITASAPLGGASRGRQVKRLEAGMIGHPVFGKRSKANPRRWAAWETQRGGMRAGFFSGPAEKGAPPARRAILGAMRDTTRKITRKA